MNTETMNDALIVVRLYWSLGPRGVVLVDASDRFASVTARNTGTLNQYVALAQRKGKNEAELATVILAAFDGDPVQLATFRALPDL